VDLLKEFEPEIETLSLIPSDGGRYEVEINGSLIYSKLSTKQHIQNNDVLIMVRKYLKERSQ
jgi:selenoprotein W-related protein